MTAGTPAPQDAETVDVLRAAIGSVYDRHDHTRLLNHVNHEEWVEAVLAALAPVRAREVEAARREAWDEGYQAGMATEYAYREAPFGRDVTEPENPYRDLAATHADDEQHDTKEDDRG